MKYYQGNCDIWDCKDLQYVTITTNGSVTKDGFAVMGGGIAREARIKFPELPRQLYHALEKDGNHCYLWPLYKVITVPTKNAVYEDSSLELIEQSCIELVCMAEYYKIQSIGVIKFGSGLGGLNWNDVRPIMERILDDRFILVDKQPTPTPLETQWYL